MSLKIKENVELAQLTTMKIGGTARYFTEITTADQLAEIFDWTANHNMPYLILGGGSNTIFDNGTYNGLVIRMDIKGFEVVEDDNDQSIIKVGAGEDWDETVKQSVDMGLSGMEALSGIPGTTGATPYQNIGAYGQEIKDTLDSVEVYDTTDRQIKTLTNSECQFGYRDSIFKSSQKGRYIITSVSFKLSKKPAEIPNYKDVQRYFEKEKISNPTAMQIRNAILEIRKNKFVDPSVMPNSGSFFKNPEVSRSVADKLLALFPEIKPYPQDNKVFPLENGNYKIAAGWLIQELGYKGKDFGKVRVDPNHALVLENKDGATQQDLLKLVQEIQASAKQKFDIDLEPEPVIVTFDS
jgi:UDP-N-acetylmuramate dehydrogenase